MPAQWFEWCRTHSMGRNSYPRQRPLTLVQQQYFLTVRFPDLRVRVRGDKLYCVGELQPSAISDKYTVELTYKLSGRPKVHVLKPRLRLACGCSRLPHVFDGNELCLYLGGEWRPDMRISDYIIPWISAWLLFYEVWLATGFWEGGGTHPDAPQHKSA